MKMALFVGIGGFLGSTSRYLIYQWFLKLIPGINPSGTLLVNIIGSFILGLMLHATSKFEKDTYLLLTTGFCGGFTTFSTFSVENVRYILTGNFLSALLYIGLSLILGIGAAFFGWFVGKNMI